MRLKVKNVFGLALAVTVSYSSCQKSSVKQTPPPIDYNSIASQIALSLNKSLTGQLGGANINNGLTVPSGFNNPGKTSNSISIPFCGYIIDTAYSSYTSSGDTTKWLSGKFNLMYTCSNLAVNGYNVYDSLRTEVHNQNFIDEYTNAQNYSFKVLDATTSSVGGSITTLISSTIYATAGKAQEYHDLSCYYLLSTLIIKNVSGVTDITSGTATFNSKTSNVDPATGNAGLFAKYTGSITWTGDHKANLIIDPSHKYVIDYTTNTITSAQ